MTISVADIEKTAATVIDGVISHEDLINTVASLGGFLPAVTFAEKGLPVLRAALQFMQQETGKSWTDVFSDLMAHLTPGQANSPILSAPAAAPATDTQAPAG